VARDVQVRARIIAKDEASGVVNRVRGSFSKLSSFLTNVFVVSLGDIVNVIRSVVSAVSGLVEAASESEDSFRQQAISLERFKSAAAPLAAILEEQAASLQKVTRFSDESIRSIQTLIVNMGATAEQIPKATQAAIELAARFKIDLNTAARDVALSLSGRLGRSLSRFVPQLRALDEQALKSGAAIDFLLKSMSGSAVKDAETFSGSLARLKNSFGELEEIIGGAITKNPILTESFKKLNEAITDPKTVAAVTQLAEGLIKLSSSAVGLVQSLPSLISGIRDFATGLETLAAPLISVGQKIDELTDRFPRLKAVLVEAFTNSFLPIKGLVNAVSELGAEMNKIETITVTTANASAQLGSAAFSAAQGVDALAAANERAARITEELGVSQADFVDTLKAAGIVLRDFVKEQATLDAVVEKARTQFRNQVIDINQYNDVIEQVVVKQAALQAELNGTNTALATTATGTKAAADGFRQLNASQAETASKLNRTAAAAGNAARSVASLNQVLGVGRAVARDAGDQAAVDAAIAAGFVPYLGGTRIDLPGGGSRLVRVA